METKPHNRRQFAYSIILMILIPVIVLINSVWQYTNAKKILQTELQKKTELSKNIISGALIGSVNNDKDLQAKIDQIAKTDAEIKEISILKPSRDGFLTTASSNSSLVGLSFKTNQNTTAWLEDKTQIAEIKDVSQIASERLGQSVSTVKSPNGQKVALLSLKVSYSDIDQLNHNAFNQNLVILLITILLIILLLANHFRFIEFAISYQKLEEVDAMKDEFISITSHELKQPMAAIKGYLDMMVTGLTGKIDQKARDHLLLILANVQRLDLLVGELLDVSRLDQGRMQFDMRPIEPNKIVAQVIEELDEEALKKKLEIKEEKIQQAIPPIFGDSERLRQVLTNLISNAIKYTNKGGITISYIVEKKYLTIKVRDTGIGMSEADSRRVFEKFYRINNEKTQDIPGTGLGLWISREIIKHMNGKISFTSKENAGTEFMISLPIIKE